MPEFRHPFKPIKKKTTEHKQFISTFTELKQSMKNLSGNPNLAMSKLTDLTKLITKIPIEKKPAYKKRIEPMKTIVNEKIIELTENKNRLEEIKAQYIEETDIAKDSINTLKEKLKEIENALKDSRKEFINNKSNDLRNKIMKIQKNIEKYKQMINNEQTNNRIIDEKLNKIKKELTENQIKITNYKTLNLQLEQTINKLS